MNEFQEALGGEQAAAVLKHFGLEMMDVAMLAALVVFTVTLIKKHVPLPGWGLLLASGVASGAWAWIWYAVTIPKPVAAGMIVFLLASGGWQFFKDVRGKWVSGGTAPKPAGAGDRLVDQ